MYQFRLDEEKRILNVRKRELTKLNESKKLMLEELEKKVVKFVLVSLNSSYFEWSLLFSLNYEV